MRDTVGRTLSSTSSLASMCGVTVITRPTGTVLTSVSKLRVMMPSSPVSVSTSTVKYTRLSTTFSTASWLLSAMIFGLDMTCTSPKVSSILIVALRLPSEVSGSV